MKEFIVNIIVDMYMKHKSCDKLSLEFQTKRNEHIYSSSNVFFCSHMYVCKCIFNLYYDFIIMKHRVILECVICKGGDGEA